METKMKIMISVVMGLVLLGLIGSFLGLNKIKTLEESHAKTKIELAEEKKREKIVTKIVIKRVPVFTRAGEVALDGNGNPIFTEESVESSITETETESRTSSNESEISTKKVTEKPAIKKWSIMAGYEPTTGQIWGGAGFRQSLFMFEATVWAGNPIAADFSPMVGLSIAF